MSHQKHKLFSALALGILVLALGGCKKEGPAEKAGKEIDKAVSNAEGHIQAIGKEIEGAVK